MSQQNEATAIQRLDTGGLLAQAIDSGAAVEVITQLVAIAKEMSALRAREAWYEAMADFQASCPSIAKTQVANTGQYTYRYASLGDMLAITAPVMGPLGLSATWKGGVSDDGKSIWRSCVISHRLGHCEESGRVVLAIATASATWRSAFISEAARGEP